MSCLVLEGPLYDVCIPYVLEMIKKVPTILSVWADEPSEKIEMFRGNAIDIVLSTKPHIGGGSRINYPNTTLVNGFKRAKELGYTHAMRFRVDNYCPTIDEFIDIFKNESSDKLVGLCWFHHVESPAPNGYIMDHIMYGPIDILIRYRSCIQSADDIRFTERFLQESYFNKTDIRYEDTLSDFKFVLHKLIEKQQKVFFTHHHTEQGDAINVYKGLGVKCQS